jgi:hypothetical protein
MSTPAATSKPTLNVPVLAKTDSATRELFRQIDAEHGVGRVMQSKAGGLVPYRLDEDTGRVEYYRRGVWGYYLDGVWTEA